MELRDHLLPTAELTPDLQHRVATALDKILQMNETFTGGAEEVYIRCNTWPSFSLSPFLRTAHVQNTWAMYQIFSTKAGGETSGPLVYLTPTGGAVAIAHPCF